MSSPFDRKRQADEKNCSLTPSQDSDRPCPAPPIDIFDNVFLLILG
jgi:hypothetical protein